MNLRLQSATALVCLSVLTACGDSAAPGNAGGGGGQGGEGAGAGASAGGATAGGHSAGGQGGGGAAPSGSVEDDYCAPLAAFVCGQAASCGCERITAGGQFDEASCVAGFAAQCLYFYGFVADAVATGDARVDPVLAAACVTELQNATPACEAPRAAILLGLCPTWFFSDEPIGATCSFPFCAGGSGFCPSGTCVARPTIGEPCDSFECAAGLLCLADVCTAPGVPGDSCSIDDECAPPLRCLVGQCQALGTADEACLDAGECAFGLACQGNQCASVDPIPCIGDASCGNQALCVSLPRCAPGGELGATCNQDAACQPALYCDGTTSQCSALPGDGEACVNGTFCASGLGCTTDFGTCAPLPLDSELCAFGPMGPNECAPGLGCLVDTCGPLPLEGEPCTVDNRCADPLGCDFTPNGSVCVTRKLAGDACQNNQVCAAGLHCDFNAGSCAADFGLGAACPLGNECGPQAVCLPDGGSQLACAPIPGLGDICQLDCAPGLVCSVDPSNARCVAPICAEI